MARDFNGTNQYANNADGTGIWVSPYRFTLAIWVNLDASARQDHIFGMEYLPSNITGAIEIGDSTVGGGFPADNKIYGGYFLNGTGWQLTPDPSNFTLSAWRHVCITFDGTTQRLYVQGSEVANSLPAFANGAPGANADLLLFQRNTNYGDGRGAEAAIWKEALSAKEVAALAAGANPQFVRPVELRFYAPLFGLHSPELDWSAGKRPMTLNNSPAAAAHPPVARHHPFAG